MSQGMRGFGCKTCSTPDHCTNVVFFLLTQGLHMGRLIDEISKPPIHPYKMLLRQQYIDLQYIHKKLGEIITVLSSIRPWLENQSKQQQ